MHSVQPGFFLGGQGGQFSLLRMVSDINLWTIISTAHSYPPLLICLICFELAMDHSTPHWILCCYLPLPLTLVHTTPAHAIFDCTQGFIQKGGGQTPPWIYCKFNYSHNWNFKLRGYTVIKSGSLTLILLSLCYMFCRPSWCVVLPVLSC